MPRSGWSFPCRRVPENFESRPVCSGSGPISPPARGSCESCRDLSTVAGNQLCGGTGRVALRAPGSPVARCSHAGGLHAGDSLGGNPWPTDSLRLLWRRKFDVGGLGGAGEELRAVGANGARTPRDAVKMVGTAVLCRVGVRGRRGFGRGGFSGLESRVHCLCRWDGVGRAGFLPELGRWRRGRLG